jgi:mannose-1-phosphate guanylyltransferase
MILAGGEGVRLRALTRAITGDDRPKQFCPLWRGETLLDQARRRVGLEVDPERTVLVLTRRHERFYAPLLPGTSPGSLVVQPENRGTAPAILYGLFRIADTDPMGSVAIVPSDHFVSDDAVFMAHVRAAWEAVARRPDLVILLGVEPDAPEPDYGWIEPGEPLPLPGLHRVRRFREKPSAPLARRLMEAGGLWNSFVTVARVPALLSLVRRELAHIYTAFEPLRDALGRPDEPDAAAEAYARISSTDFSHSVLGRGCPSLAVRPVRDVRWSDWGRPERVLATLVRIGIEPGWPSLPAAASA